MFFPHTQKQLKYFDEVIRLHYKEGYGQYRIARVLPISHDTASRWIAIFAKEKSRIQRAVDMRKTQKKQAPQAESDVVRQQQVRIEELEKRLKQAEIKAEAYEEMINVAEAMFNIPIRKKAGAKQ